MRAELDVASPASRSHEPVQSGRGSLGLCSTLAYVVTGSVVVASALTDDVKPRRPQVVPVAPQDALQRRSYPSSVHRCG